MATKQTAGQTAKKVETKNQVSDDYVPGDEDFATDEDIAATFGRTYCAGATSYDDGMREIAKLEWRGFQPLQSGVRIERDGQFVTAIAWVVLAEGWSQLPPNWYRDPIEDTDTGHDNCHLNPCNKIGCPYRGEA